jgi:protein-disulfide isomerase
MLRLPAPPRAQGLPGIRHRAIRARRVVAHEAPCYTACMSVPLELPVGPEDHAIGAPSAKVTLVEYGDYECPYCTQAFPVVKELIARHGPSLRFVFRHAPQTRLHPHAELAAEAAEAAGAQGRFWEMHAVLFGKQPPLDLDSLAAEAAALGLDVARFRADVESHRFRPVVRRLELSGAHTVRGTPTFFLEGRRFEDGTDVETLSAAIAAAARAR